MATFTTDPRIAYAQGMRKNYLQRALSPIQLPQNPYGGSPLASALQRVTEGYLAGQEGREAAKYKRQQEDAQSRVLGELLSRGRGATGASQYGARQVSGGPPVDVFQPSMRDEYYRISDTGQQIPASTALSQDVIKAAGTTPGLYGLQLEEARLAGRQRSEENRLNFAKRKLAESQTDQDKEYWLSEIDAVSRAERSLDLTAKIAEEERKFGIDKSLIDVRGQYTGQWAKDKNQGGIVVPVSNAELYSKEGQKRYSRVNIEEFAPAVHGKFERNKYDELSNSSVKYGMRIAENEQLLQLLRSGNLDTGSLQPLLTRLKGFAADFNISVQGLNAAQVFEAVSNRRALEMRNPASGLGLTGTTSDKDLDFLIRSVIALSKTEGANEALLIMEIARDRRLNAIDRIRMDFIQMNPGKVGGHDAIVKFIESTPLLKDDEEEALNKLINLHKQGAGPGGAPVIPTVTYQPQSTRRKPS
jgi:hypothetical protein